MPTPRLKQICSASIVLCAMLVVAPFFVAMPRAKSSRNALSAKVSESPEQSRITGITIAGSQPAGSFGGVAYRRTWGTVSGIVAPRDTILGMDDLAQDADGNYDYQSEF